MYIFVHDLSIFLIQNFYILTRNVEEIFLTHLITDILPLINAYQFHYVSISVTSIKTYKIFYFFITSTVSYDFQFSRDIVMRNHKVTEIQWRLSRYLCDRRSLTNFQSYENWIWAYLSFFHFLLYIHANRYN